MKVSRGNGQALQRKQQPPPVELADGDIHSKLGSLSSKTIVRVHQCQGSRHCFQINDPPTRDMSLFLLLLFIPSFHYYVYLVSLLTFAYRLCLYPSDREVS